MIQTAGAERIITVDLHSDMVTGFFNIHVKHVFGLGIFNDVVRKMKGDLVIVAPDAGGAKRAQRFADELNLPLAIIEKKRSLDKLHTVDSVRIIGDVKGHDAIIVDDVIVAGSTTAKASYALKESGARKVYAFATHADFVGDTVRTLSDSPLNGVWVSDTIQITAAQTFDKLHIVSSSDIISEEIGKLLR